MTDIKQATGGSDSKGFSLIILSDVLLALVNTIVKSVHGWSTSRMLVIRNSVDFCLCMTMWVVFRYEVPRPKVILWLIFRGIFYIVFLVFFWASLQSCLPLGDVIVLSITFAPMFLVLLTRMLLGEKIPNGWPLQFFICVIGALLVNKPMAPDPTCSPTTALLPMAAAFAGALSNLVSRQNKDVPPPVVCVFNDVIALIYATVTTALSSDSASLLPDRIDKNVVLLALAGLAGWSGLLCNVKGYQTVSVAAVGSIAQYVSVPLGYFIQVAVFGQPIDTLSAIGATIIACTNVTVMVSKYYAAKAPKEEVVCPASPMTYDPLTLAEQKRRLSESLLAQDVEEALDAKEKSMGA